MAGLLYQQGVQKLEIIVRRDISVASGTKGLATGKASATQAEDLGENIDDDSTKKKTLKQFAMVGAISVAKQIVFTGFDYYVGGIGMKNGDQALQDQVNAKISMVKDVINVGTSIAGGAIAGSAFGPVGTVVGAIVGVVSSGISIASRELEAKRQYDFAMFKENNAIEYNKARAGLFGSDGRVR